MTLAMTLWLWGGRSFTHNLSIQSSLMLRLNIITAMVIVGGRFLCCRRTEAFITWRCWSGTTYTLHFPRLSWINRAIGTEPIKFELVWWSAAPTNFDSSTSLLWSPWSPNTTSSRLRIAPIYIYVLECGQAKPNHRNHNNSMTEWYTVCIDLWKQQEYRVWVWAIDDRFGGVLVCLFGRSRNRLGCAVKSL